MPMRVAGGSADPFFPYQNDGSHIEYKNTAGRVLADARLVPGERTACFIGAGQSLIASYVTGVGSIYTPTSSKVQNLSPMDGGVYLAQDPMLGCDGTGGTWMGRLGDQLITDGIYDRVIFIPLGSGSSGVTTWGPGGVLDERISMAYKRARAVGLTVTAVLWQQGEADNAGGMNQATYASRLTTLINYNKNRGYDAPWMLAKSTWYVGAPSAAIQAAIDSVVNGADIFAGANTDLLSDAYRAVDQTHFITNGAIAASLQWSTAIDAANLPGMLI